MPRVHAAVALVPFLLFSAAAHAQEKIVSSLPFKGGQTAGPNATDFLPPDDHRDLWVIEDITLAEFTELTRLESLGIVFPQPVVVSDVTVRVYKGFPPTGGVLVAQSKPGAGVVVPSGLNSLFRATFEGQFLPAGQYWVAWNASVFSNSQTIILWAVAGAHAVGGGQPDNAWLWNPGGGWGYPDNYKKVPADLGGNGQTGVNHVLFGKSACYADCERDGDLDLFDFLCFQGAHAQQDLYADCEGDGDWDLFDFLCFQGLHADGCP